MTDAERVILANLYIGQLSAGRQTIANLQVRYDDPALGQEALLSEVVPVDADVQGVYQPAPNAEVQQSILALAKYRQTQIAEAKLQQAIRGWCRNNAANGGKNGNPNGRSRCRYSTANQRHSLAIRRRTSEADRKEDPDCL
jgi:Ca-activated chloride channel family protein